MTRVEVLIDVCQTLLLVCNSLTLWMLVRRP